MRRPAPLMGAWPIAQPEHLPALSEIPTCTDEKHVRAEFHAESDGQRHAHERRSSPPVMATNAIRAGALPSLQGLLGRCLTFRKRQQRRTGSSRAKGSGEPGAPLARGVGRHWAIPVLPHAIPVAREKAGPRVCSLLRQVGGSWLTRLFMTPSEIRAELLEQHAELRRMVDRARPCSDPAYHDALTVQDRLREMRLLAYAVQRHNQREEVLLRDLLLTVDAWAQARAEVMTDEHVREHEAFYRGLLATPGVAFEWLRPSRC
jgi:hypothetical protein